MPQTDIFAVLNRCVQGSWLFFHKAKKQESPLVTAELERQGPCAPHHHRERMDWHWIFFFLFTLSLRVRKILFKKLNRDRNNTKPQDCNHFSRNHGKEQGLKLFCGCSPMKPALLCNAQAKTEHSNFPSSSPSHQEKTGASQIKNRLMLQLIQTELFLFKCFPVSATPATEVCVISLATTDMCPGC